MPETAVNALREWVKSRLALYGIPCETIPVPRGWTPPYVGLAGTTEGDWDSYNAQFGHRGTETLHCWGRDKNEAQTLYADVYTALHRQRFEIGVHVGAAYLNYVTDLPDPAGLGHQVVAGLRAKSQDTSAGALPGDTLPEEE